MADASQQAQQKLDQTIVTLTRELSEATRAFQQFIAAQSRTHAAQEANKKATEELNDELIDYQKTLVKGRKLTDEQQKLVVEAVALKKKELEAERALVKAVEEEARIRRDFASDQERIARASRITSAREFALSEAKGRQRSVTEALSKSFAGLTKNTDYAGAALAWFGSALSTAKDQVLAQNRVNGGLIEGSGSLIAALAQQQNEALKFKVDGATFANLTNGARQMFNAMGGTSKGLEQLGPAVDRFTIMTGSFADGLKMATEVAKSFAEKGIRPTIAGMEQYHEDLQALRRQTGLSVDQAVALYDEVAKDQESIQLLRQARAGEREAILASQRALIQQGIAAGQTAEQAKQAALMLNKMVAAKPLDRLKQAAKIRAIGGAMGVGGANEAAQAVIAGSRATGDQKLALQQFGQNITNALDQSAQGGLGSEIFATTLADKLNLDQYFGKNSPLSTTLGDTLRPAFADLSKQFVDVTKDPLAQTVTSLAGIWEQAKIIASGAHWGGVIASGIAALIAVTAGKQIASFGSNVLGKIGGFLSGESKLAAPVAQAAGGGAAGAGGGIASKLLSGAKLLGPVAAAAGGVYEGYSDYKENGKVGSAVGKGAGTFGGALAGGAAGALAGSVIPVVGTLIGGLIGGALGAWGGGKGGKWLGEKADAMLPTSTAPAKAQASDAVKQATNTADAIMDATVASADGIAAQVRKLDTSNDYLKAIADLQQKNVDLTERLVVAMTMTDKEKQAARGNLRRDNKFASSYNYG